MTLAELDALEARLSIRLPECYRRTMLEYPFQGRGDVEQAELVNDVDLLIELNSQGRLSRLGTGDSGFIIGTDQGEETYFIKPAELSTSVFCFQLETRECRELCTSWHDYIARCRSQIEEVVADERRTAKRAGRSIWGRIRRLLRGS